MNTISIPTTQNIELEYPVAGVQERLLSGFIDAVVLGAYILGFHYIFQRLAIIDYSQEFWEDELDSWQVLYYLCWLPAMFYSLIAESVFRGQTLGKLLTRTRTIHLNGNMPDTASYFLRWLFKLIDVWFFTGFSAFAVYTGNFALGFALFVIFSGWIGILVITIAKNNQRLGDLVAGTTVIKLKLVTTFLDTIYVETSDAYKVVFPEIRSLSDRDVSILKTVLDVGLKNKNPVLLNKLANKVKDVAGIESKMPNQQFLETILADYNHFFGKK
ncbi:MAG: RDD family protein [Bacteroidia bacterium]|nr:RDD family protein [Bacteroidia bacterium]